MPVVPSAILVLIVGGVFLFRRADVRLVLMLSAAVMFLVRATQPEVAGQRIEAFSQFFTEFARGMTSLSWVVPICSAMGFAYVCKVTECDSHLVHLLCRPLAHVRWLLIPGGVAVAFFVNSAIVSQTSTISVVGPVLIPLLVAAGVSRQTGGAMLLLGGSMGGELLNPAAVEVTAIANVTKAAPNAIIGKILPYNLLACGTALLVFWWMALAHERKAHGFNTSIAEDTTKYGPGSIGAGLSVMADYTPLARISLFKAAVPLVPILLLMVVRPILQLIPNDATPQATTRATVVATTRATTTPTTNPAARGLMPNLTEQATIAAAMLIGVVCACAANPKRIGGVAAAFFDGAGFAYAHVISVIVAATMFATSIEVNGLIRMMADGVSHEPRLVTVASVLIPWLMATITGTAVGTAPLIIGVLLPVAMRTVGPEVSTAHGLRVGAACAITAQYGRTNSPVAPVVLFSATLAQSTPITLVKRVVVPLLVGGAVLLVAVMMEWF